MFSIGDAVKYRNYGVCKITEIQEKTVNEETRAYYVLKPVFEERTTIFAPVGNQKTEEKMLHTLSPEEIHRLIQEMPKEDTIWLDNESARKELYKTILEGADRFALVKLIKTLHQHRENLKQANKGKKLRTSDEAFLKNAEKALYDEVAYVLDLKQDEVLPFISQQIETQERSK